MVVRQWTPRGVTATPCLGGSCWARTSLHAGQCGVFVDGIHLRRHSLQKACGQAGRSGVSSTSLHTAQRSKESSVRIASCDGGQSSGSSSSPGSIAPH